MTLRLLSLMLVATSIGASCETDVSGCENFRPESSSLAVGDSVTVDVRTGERLWSSIDVAGNYWESEEPLPPAAPRNSTARGVATLVEAELAANGEIFDGLVVVDFGEFGQVEFEGPLGCE